MKGAEIIEPKSKCGAGLSYELYFYIRTFLRHKLEINADLKFYSPLSLTFEAMCHTFSITMKCKSDRFTGAPGGARETLRTCDTLCVK